MVSIRSNHSSVPLQLSYSTRVHVITSCAEFKAWIINDTQLFCVVVILWKRFIVGIIDLCKQNGMAGDTSWYIYIYIYIYMYMAPTITCLTLMPRGYNAAGVTSHSIYIYIYIYIGFFFLLNRVMDVTHHKSRMSMQVFTENVIRWNMMLSLRSRAKKDIMRRNIIISPWLRPKKMNTYPQAIKKWLHFAPVDIICKCEIIWLKMIFFRN